MSTIIAGMFCHPPGMTTIAPAALKEAWRRPAARVSAGVDEKGADQVPQERRGQQDQAPVDERVMPGGSVPAVDLEGQRQVDEEERHGGEQ